MRTPTDILGVQPGASRAEVRRAFQRYALRHHPDHGGDTERFVEGTRAYEMLMARAAKRSRAPSNVAFVRRRTLRQRLAAAARGLTALTAHGRSSGSEPRRRTGRW